MTTPCEPRPKVVVIMPGRNVARTVQAAFDGIPAGFACEVILVDNRSQDGTPEVAEKLGITVIRHERDRGYGGSLKTCLAAALASGADSIAELHPDNQYDASYLPALLAEARRPGTGVVLGSRFLPPRRALEGGMPLWKYLSNRMLSRINGALLGVHLAEFHTGLRVYDARFVADVALEELSDDFVFSFEILVEALRRGLAVREVAADARYFPEASSNPFRGSLRYGLGTLRASLAYRLHPGPVTAPRPPADGRRAA